MGRLATGPGTDFGLTVTKSADQSRFSIPAAFERKEFTVPEPETGPPRLEAMRLKARVDRRLRGERGQD